MVQIKHQIIATMIMTSLKIQDGFTPLVNELLEALTRYDFSKYEYKIILAVIRKTEGYHKTMATIGNSKLASMTGMERNHVGKTVRQLIIKRVLIRDTSTYKKGIGINKNHQEWGEIQTRDFDYPVLAETGDRLPPLLAETGDRLPPLLAETGDRLPPLLAETGDRLPPLLTETGDRLPPLLAETGDRLPPLLAETGDRLPPLLAETGDRLPPLLAEKLGTGYPQFDDKSGDRLPPGVGTGYPQFEGKSGDRLPPHKRKYKEKTKERSPPPRFALELPREENQNRGEADFEKLPGEEKKTDDEKQNRGGGDFENLCQEQKPLYANKVLIYPRSLCELEQTTAAQLLKTCGDDAQAILDVLAAALKADKVQTSALALLSGLVRRHEGGTFDPIPGLKIKIDREKVHPKPQAVKVLTAVDIEAGKINLATMKTRLGMR
jgi:phage replication O-like protein O